jgi:hypothetical protein
MKGTIIYALITAISREVKKGKDEVIKPTKSSPNYEEYFPKFKVLENALVQEVKGRKIVFDLKMFNDSNLIVEAETSFNIKDTKSFIELKQTLFEESKKLASEYGPSPFFEEYIFFLVKDANGPVEKYVEKNKEEIAAILKDEPIQLEKKEIDNTIASNIRYVKEDIAIIDWDGAFLLDAKGDFKEAIALLELANIQLVNLRILDNRLQEKISTLKRQLEPGDIKSFLRLSPYMKEIIKSRSQSIMELENIDNALKLYGDWYSAKVYDLAGKKFYLEKWKNTVEKKLNVLKDLYEMVSHIMTERYNLWLEFTIVILIVFEIAMAFIVK